MSAKEQNGEEPKKARQYQVELLEKAKTQNSIVYLGTGAGKTFIATMMIKEFMDEVIKHNKKTVFLVHRVILATQQSEFISRNTPLTVRSFSGSDNVDNWDKSDWQQHIDSHQVLVMVHQVFLDLLNRGYFSLSNVNLLIVDECHHSLGNSPYNQIFTNHYNALKEAGHATPRVLGLTASIVTTKVANVKQFLREKDKLEKTLDSSTITTEDLANLLKFVTQPQEALLPYNGCQSMAYVEDVICAGRGQLQELCTTRIDKLKSTDCLEDFVARRNLEKDVTKAYKKYNRLLEQTDRCIREELGVLFGEFLLQDTFKDDLLLLADAGDDYTEQLVRSTHATLCQLKDAIERELRKFAHLADWDKFNALSTDKVVCLVDKLDNFSLGSSSPLFGLPDSQNLTEDKRHMTAIIFVKERQTALALANLLNWVATVKPSLGHLKVGSAVGGATSSALKEPSAAALQKAMDEKLNLERTMAKFRSGQLNVIVSTDVLEEGMDVQQCNLVIRFNRIETFRAYVQSKGRARAKPSQYLMMVQYGKELQQWNEALSNYRSIEVMSIDQCHDHDSGDNDDDDDDDDEDVEEPYYVNPSDKINSPRVTGLGAISLLYQYIQTLPSDRFTRLSPVFDYRTVSTVEPRSRLMSAIRLSGQNDAAQVECVLYMPHLTPYQEPFVGNARKTKKQAKRSVALKACKQLHIDHLLDDNLLPRKRVLQLDIDIDIDTVTSGKPKVGTKRSKAYYPLEWPLHFKSGHAYLYKLNMTLFEPTRSWKKLKNIYNPDDYERKLGIFFGKRLPEVATLPVTLYTSSGTVMAQLELIQDSSCATKVTPLMTEFHAVALEQVTGFNRPWMRHLGAEKDLLIVPLCNNVIDDKFLADWKDKRRPKSCSNKEPFEFNLDDYIDAVVTPQHRSMGNYFVEEVVYERSPKSKLPNHSLTFAKHYEHQYGCKVTDEDQPLLRISNADKHHFMFAPVGVEEKKDGNMVVDIDKERFLDTKTLLIPELVAVQPLPASLWREIQMVPFVLHKVAQYMRLDSLRLNIWKAFGCSVKQTNNVDHDFSVASDGFVKFDQLLMMCPRCKKPPSIQDFMVACTAKGAGELVDLERLEILGDVFLKFIVSLALFCNQTIPNGDEGFLTQYRSNLVGNKRLFYLAKSKGLEKVFSAQKFEPQLCWLAPRFTQDTDLEIQLCEWDKEFRTVITDDGGNLPQATLFHMMKEEEMLEYMAQTNFKGKDHFMKTMRKRVATENSVPRGNRVLPREHVLITDKALADQIEALIGLFLAKMGQDGAVKVMAWLGFNLSPGTDIKTTLALTSKEGSIDSEWFGTKKYVPQNGIFKRNTCVSDSMIQCRLDHLVSKLDVDQIERVLGYSFKEKSFLLQAMTHASYSTNRVTESYERLEFLGDAVLDYIITCHLYTLPGRSLSPGVITDLRSALVNNNTFASVAVDNGLHKHLLYHNPELFKRINRYVDYHLDNSNMPETAGQILLANLELYNEEDCPVLEDVEVPKVLGDTIEAMMGAIYLDSGCDLAVVWKVYRHLCKGFDDIVHKKPKNFVKQLMEAFPLAVNFKPVETRADGKIGQTVVVIKGCSTKMFFKGIGNNKKLAKQAAAKCAMRELKRHHLIADA